MTDHLSRLRAGLDRDEATVPICSECWEREGLGPCLITASDREWCSRCQRPTWQGLRAPRLTEDTTETGDRP